MTKVKVAINGFGRIGRTVFREYFKNGNAQFEIAAINSPGKIEEYAHLLQFDSIHGRFQADVSVGEQKLIIDGKEIPFYGEKDPKQIPWAAHDIKVVIDATGIFKDKAGLGQHMGDTVKKVIMCAPGKDLDGTFVVGINHETYDSTKHDIVSNASCTTNCLAPIAKVLHDKFGIENGAMTTVHSYTSDQRILDASHSDLRRARAAFSMIPTTTGAAKAVGLVIPELSGKLDGFAIRVPTPNVSLVDLTANLKKNVTADEVNSALKEASETYLKGVLATEARPLVSVDFMGMRESSCADLGMTNVIGGNVVKVVSWYDNEAGFSNRVIDLANYMVERL